MLLKRRLLIYNFKACSAMLIHSAVSNICSACRRDSEPLRRGNGPRPDRKLPPLYSELHCDADTNGKDKRKRMVEKPDIGKAFAHGRMQVLHCTEGAIVNNSKGFSLLGMELRD